MVMQMKWGNFRSWRGNTLRMNVTKFARGCEYDGLVHSAPLLFHLGLAVRIAFPQAICSMVPGQEQLRLVSSSPQVCSFLLAASSQTLATNSAALNRIYHVYQRTPFKKAGGAKPHEETPLGKQFPTPLTSALFHPPPHIPFLLWSPLEIPRISPQLTSSNPFSEGLETWFPRGHPREVLLRYVLAPPPPSQESRATFVWTFRKSSCKRAIFCISGFWVGFWASTIGDKKMTHLILILDESC